MPKNKVSSQLIFSKLVTSISAHKNIILYGPPDFPFLKKVVDMLKSNYNYRHFLNDQIIMLNVKQTFKSIGEVFVVQNQSLPQNELRKA